LQLKDLCGNLGNQLSKGLEKILGIKEAENRKLSKTDTNLKLLQESLLSLKRSIVKKPLPMEMITSQKSSNYVGRNTSYQIGSKVVNKTPPIMSKEISNQIYKPLTKAYCSRLQIDAPEAQAPSL
jgi:hypothetical protein